MLTLEGLATSPGLVKGPLYMLRTADEAPEMKTVADTAAEAQRLRDAIKTVDAQLEVLHDKTEAEAGAEAAAIFEIHRMMLEDDDFLDNIYGIIERERLAAEYAVYTTGAQFAAIFAGMDDDLMRERATDVRDLSARLVDVLAGRTATPLSDVEAPVVVAADDLMPSQTMLLDKRLVLAFLCRKGSMNSHASILARSLGIPSVSCLGDGFDHLKQGGLVAVDGGEGVVVLNPDRQTLAAFEQKVSDLAYEKQVLRKLVGLPAETLDGARIELCANIGHPDEADRALAEDAEGVGLFRSEFLYLDAADFPSEEAQYQAYKAALEKMAPRRVVIRTLDLGADKQAPYFHLEPEENPALGYRAIRICLDRLDIFLVQLRALLRASVHGRLAVMFPMVTGPDEVGDIYKVLDEAKAELDAEGVPYSRDIEFGIMIETPAAVLMADQLAPLVDFFSVGTNDLTQYTFAVDRMNDHVGYLFRPGSVALMRAIHQVARQAHEAGIWVGICGESAADPELLPYYVAMGIDELSMTPHAILRAKDHIRRLKKSECEKMLQAYLACPPPPEKRG